MSEKASVLKQSMKKLLTIQEEYINVAGYNIREPNASSVEEQDLADVDLENLNEAMTASIADLDDVMLQSMESCSDARLGTAHSRAAHSGAERKRGVEVAHSADKKYLNEHSEAGGEQELRIAYYKEMVTRQNFYPSVDDKAIFNYLQTIDAFASTQNGKTSVPYLKTVPHGKNGWKNLPFLFRVRGERFVLSRFYFLFTVKREFTFSLECQDLEFDITERGFQIYEDNQSPEHPQMSAAAFDNAASNSCKGLAAKTLYKNLTELVVGNLINDQKFGPAGQTVYFFQLESKKIDLSSFINDILKSQQEELAQMVVFHPAYNNSYDEQRVQLRNLQIDKYQVGPFVHVLPQWLENCQVYHLRPDRNPFHYLLTFNVFEYIKPQTDAPVSAFKFYLRKVDIQFKIEDQGFQVYYILFSDVGNKSKLMRGYLYNSVDELIDTELLPNQLLKFQRLPTSIVVSEMELKIKKQTLFEHAGVNVLTDEINQRLKLEKKETEEAIWQKMEDTDKKLDQESFLNGQPKEQDCHDFTESLCIAGETSPSPSPTLTLSGGTTYAGGTTLPSTLLQFDHFVATHQTVCDLSLQPSQTKAVSQIKQAK